MEKLFVSVDDCSNLFDNKINKYTNNSNTASNSNKPTLYTLLSKSRILKCPSSTVQYIIQYTVHTLLTIIVTIQHDDHGPSCGSPSTTDVPYNHRCIGRERLTMYTIHSRLECYHCRSGSCHSSAIHLILHWGVERWLVCHILAHIPHHMV